MKPLRPVVCALLAALLSSFLPAFSQSPAPRLQSAIAGTSRVALPGSRTPRADAAEDLGPLSPATPIPGITLVFSRSSAQEAALQQLLAAQQSTASPSYHQWLTPSAFAARFATAPEDLAATQTWLAAQGFHIDSIPPSQDRITFSGTAAQVQAAFGAELHRYRTPGELHFAPASNLTLPAELASITAAVLHLSDFRPKPNLKAQSRPRPDYTALSNQAHYLGPGDIATMYDLTPLSANSFDGAGQSLAVVGQSFLAAIDLSVITSFQAQLSQPNAPTTVLVPNSGVEAISQGDEGESQIDLEYSSSIAPQANIFLVYVGDNQNYNVLDALDFAITGNIAPVVSISYGICEAALSQSNLDQQNALFEQAAAQGQTLIASSGDAGSTACAPFTTADGITAAQQQSLAVNFPASSPYVTAVGGTQMAAGTFAAGSSPYWSSATAASTVSSLLSYVPEVAWNEGSATLGIGAGGGGASVIFPRPAWQTGVPGIPSGTTRLLPDLALQSSLASPGFLACLYDPGFTGSATASCTNGLLDSNNQYTVLGGTSFAAPVFAGFVAILNQVKNTTGQGNLGPVLYRLAADPVTYAAAFHDITAGTIACPPVTGNCSAAGESGYAATIGYDQATGLGSLDFNALAAAWPSAGATPLTPTETFLSAAATAAPGATVPVQIFVQSAIRPGQAGSAPIPTGTVSVSVDGAVVNASLSLSTDPASFNTLATYDLITPATPGSHLVTVLYPGDSTHSPSKAVSAVLVGNVAASGGATLAVVNLTVANNASGVTQVTATPSGGYNGRLVWSLTAGKSPTSLSACFLLAPLTVSGITSTQLTIGVGSACNALSPASRKAIPLLDRRASAPAPGNTPSNPAFAIYAGLAICGLLARNRRKIALPPLLALLCLTLVCAGLTSCGGGSSANPSPATSPVPVTAPAATSYTLTLTGTDSVNTTITAATAFVLTVN